MAVAVAVAASKVAISVTAATVEEANEIDFILMNDASP